MSYPEYIPALSTWDDPDWRAAAAKPAGSRTEAEQLLNAAGPRDHPWGPAAYTGKLADGTSAIFPNEDAYRAHVNGNDVLRQLDAGLAANAAQADPQPLPAQVSAEADEH